MSKLGLMFASEAMRASRDRAARSSVRLEAEPASADPAAPGLPAAPNTPSPQLAQALRAGSNRELDWLWLAATVTDEAEQRYALERALYIQPDSRVARAGLLALQPARGRSSSPKRPRPLTRAGLELGRPGRAAVQLSRACLGLRVRSGHAWVSAGGRDYVVGPGETLALPRHSVPAVVSLVRGDAATLETLCAA